MNHNICIREGNLFCYAFDDDAIILNYLFGYKLKKQQVGFPKNALEKVIDELEEKKIDYKIISEEEFEKTFNKENQYNIILNDAKNEREKQELKKELEIIINSFDKKQLEKLIAELKKKET